MKKFKNSFIMISLLLILLVLASCQNSMIQEPAIKIFYDSEELKPIYYGDRNNKDKEDIEDVIKNVMVGKRFLDLPKIYFGEKIEIEALNFKTTEFEIYYYIVDERGNIVSDYDINPLILTSIEDGNPEFIFEKREDLEKYYNYMVEDKSIYCLLIRSKINKSSFAFATLVLGQSR
ncbi:hypothetical protein BHU72_01705 [Desulfuribacillus stibiiarsenatis]|uniref:Lipoprotein n=1 Tax=Desulfuribacillus stibiiarsenatis TaxID=1390249 RepID=A0A1E5LA51_9FIRM|nr:hypothetical protein [Desulfuribacillus stibiiarsenatis]OEH86997.1 hypothetical protein BHU72_01705 [Desulfuribacillus stibiiarsenatis]